MYKDKNFYLNLFQVSEAQLERLAAEGLKGGGSYCDLFFENTSYNDLLLRDGIVSSGGFHIDYGVGIRVLKGDKTGYAYSESTDSRSMAEAALAASKIAEGATGTTAAIRRRIVTAPKDRYSYEYDWRSSDATQLVPWLEQLKEKIAAKDSRIVKIIVSFSGQVSDILMFNSIGELTYETRPMGILSASVVFSQNGRIENKNSSRAYRAGTEMLTEALLDEIADSIVSGIDDRFAAKRPKGGQSVFSEKMGQKICDGSISIVDDGTIQYNRGAVNFDDEGVPGQKTYMVKDGVLASYLHDRISAGFYGVSPTGNGRRESFRYAPIPRMRATYMESGKADKESIIASVKKGIFVDQFSNGEVQIGEGDFTFYVKSGFLIENGRLTQPVKDINIIGNGPQALADIVAVGNDLKIDEGAWTCGKGQSCPVSCGIPTVLIDKLTVGGE